MVTFDPVDDVDVDVDGDVEGKFGDGSRVAERYCIQPQRDRLNNNSVATMERDDVDVDVDDGGE